MAASDTQETYPIYWASDAPDCYVEQRDADFQPQVVRPNGLKSDVCCAMSPQRAAAHLDTIRKRIDGPVPTYAYEYPDTPQAMLAATNKHFGPPKYQPEGMWRPIESAPKTGEWIKARSNTGYEWAVRWDGRNGGWFTPGNNRREDLNEWLCVGESGLAPVLAPAANPAPEKKSQEWQPIDTAPKDGTRILLYVPIMAQHPGLSYCVARWIQYHAEIADQSGWYEADRTRVNFAEYWLPLDVLPPPPPEIKPDPIATDDDLIARLMKIVGCTSPQSSFESWLKGYAAGTKKLADLNSSNNPEFDATDGAHPAWWRGHDHGAQSICREVEKILDRKKDAFGACAEPWNTIRKRLLGLLAVVECRESAKADDGVLIADELRKRITEIRDRMTVVEGRLTDIKTLNFHAGRTSGVQLVLDTIFPAADEPKQADGE